VLAGDFVRCHHSDAGQQRSEPRSDGLFVIRVGVRVQQADLAAGESVIKC
jgi:hypothetical protein